jgi:hypothetical protein
MRINNEFGGQNQVPGYALPPLFEPVLAAGRCSCPAPAPRSCAVVFSGKKPLNTHVQCLENWWLAPSTKLLIALCREPDGLTRTDSTVQMRAADRLPTQRLRTTYPGIVRK